MLHPLLPGGAELGQAADIGHQVNAGRRDTQLDHRVCGSEVVTRQRERIKRCTEGAQRLPYPLRILVGRLDPQVEVLRTTRNAVHGHGVGADDEEPGAGVKQGEEAIDPVVGHVRRTTRTGMVARV